MTTLELIDWLDEKMETHGSGKLIPPDEVLEDTFLTLTELRLRTEITERVLREADIDGQVAEAMAALDPPDGETFRHQIEDVFEDDPETGWRAIIEEAAEEPS